MAEQTTADRTSASELQLSMEYLSEAFIRQYALEVFGDENRTEEWLKSEILALDRATPESLLGSAKDENLCRVPGVLVQIDYGVVG